MDVYVQRLTTPQAMSSKQLPATRGGVQIEELIPDKLYKVWLILWSFFSKQTTLRRLLVEGEPIERKLTMYAPAYVFFPAGTGFGQVDLLAFDHEVFLAIRDWARRTAKAKPLSQPPLTQRIPDHLEIENIWEKKIVQKGHVIENYDEPIELWKVLKDIGDPSRLMAVTLWCDRNLDNIRLHNVVLKEWAPEVMLRIELREPEEKLSKNERKFISTLLELVPLLYSMKPKDIQKACVGY